MTAEKLDNVKDGKLISLLKRLLKEIKSFVKDLTVTISIAQFLISLAGSYKLQYVSRFTITGIQITTPTSSLDIGPQILEATKGIAAIKTFIAAYGKKTVNGLGAISSNQLIPYIQ